MVKKMRMLCCLIIVTGLIGGVIQATTIGIAAILGNGTVPESEQNTISDAIARKIKIGSAEIIDIGSLGEYRPEGADAKTAFREIRRLRNADYCYIHRITKDENNTAYRYSVNVIFCETAESVFRKKFVFTSLDAYLYRNLPALMREIASRLNLGQTAYQDTRAYIAFGIDKYYDACTNSAAELDETERNLLYAESARSCILPVTLNLYPGFGIGSFVQGDAVSGAIIALLHAGGYVVGVYGVYSEFIIKSSEMTNTKMIQDAIMPYAIVSASCILLGYALGVIIPAYRTDQYNKTLREILRPTPSIFDRFVINTQPYVDAKKNDDFVVGLSMGF